MKVGKRIERCTILVWMKLKSNDGFGMNELLGIAAALMLAAFIIIPGLQDFANDVMERLDGWWTGHVIDDIFPPSLD